MTTEPDLGEFGLASSRAAGAWPVPGRSAVSFHPRNGRMTRRRALVLDTQLPDFAISAQHWDDVASSFERNAPAVVEIGFGQGEATVAFAAEFRGHNVLAVDVHVPGIAHLVDLCSAAALTNVRIMRGDALVLLNDVVPSGALSAIHVFFPDPWPKRRQQHRRLVQGDTAALFADRLASGAMLRVATDDSGYAAQIRRVLAATPNLVEVDHVRPPWRPITKFESRALRANREIAEFCYARR